VYEIRAFFLLDGLPANVYMSSTYPKQSGFKVPDMCLFMLQYDCLILCHNQWYRPIIYICCQNSHDLFCDMKLDNTVKPCIGPSVMSVIIPLEFSFNVCTCICVLKFLYKLFVLIICITIKSV
jgi:hypothetical protein